MQVEDVTFLKGDQLWRTGDEFDSVTLEAFQDVNYVSNFTFLFFYFLFVAKNRF